MAVHNEDIQITIGPTVDVAAGTGRAWTHVVPGASGTKWEVLEVKLLPDTALTANGTNYTTFTLANTTKSLTIATRAYSATNSVANTPETLTITAASKYADGGDVLTWTKAETGTGLAAGCRAQVRLRRIS